MHSEYKHTFVFNNIDTLVALFLYNLCLTSTALFHYIILHIRGVYDLNHYHLLVHMHMELYTADVVKVYHIYKAIQTAMITFQTILSLSKIVS